MESAIYRMDSVIHRMKPAIHHVESTIYRMMFFNAPTLYLVLVFGPILLVASYVMWNLFFHPLRQYPGPKFSAALPFPYFRALLTGRISYYCLQLHREYGDVVRIAPNELSYATGDAWKDIHERRPGHALLPKEENFYTAPPGGVHSIITADHEHHMHIRRLVSHAFSEKALRDQEPLMKVYVDLLINRLKDKAKNEEVVDVVSWYNWTTFDLVGDLTFGEPFNCLKDAMYHPWVDLLFSSVKVGAFFAAAAYFPGGLELLKLLVPKEEMKKRDEHMEYTTDKVKRRLAAQTDRADFMSSILHHNEKKAMTEAEIISTAWHLIIAGSETTATLLSGATFHLLRNPETMQKLKDEVRSAFQTEDDITLARVNGLTYMLAVLDEGLRIYPPVPVGLPRRVPKGGEIILDKFVPEGTVVSVNHWSIYHWEKNFRDPFAFIPERWLGDPRFESDQRKALQPFSTGPRNCIGKNLAYAEMRLIMARMIWNFDMELVDRSQDWVAEQEMYTVWDKGPLNVKLTLVKR